MKRIISLVYTFNLVFAFFVNDVYASNQSYQIRPSIYAGLLRPTSNIVTSEIRDANYTGISRTNAEIEAFPPESYPFVRFIFLNRVGDIELLPTYGLEVALQKNDDLFFFVGLDFSNSTTATSIVEVNLPLQRQLESRANYSRRILIESQHIAFGFEKSFLTLYKRMLFSIRYSLQAHSTRFTDQNQFAFISGPLAGEQRNDHYYLSSPSSYGMEFGTRIYFKITKMFLIGVYGGYLLDLSQNYYRLDSRDFSFIDDDELTSAPNLWAQDEFERASILSSDWKSYNPQKANLSSWQMRVSLSLTF